MKHPDAVYLTLADEEKVQRLRRICRSIAVGNSGNQRTFDDLSRRDSKGKPVKINALSLVRYGINGPTLEDIRKVIGE